MYAHSCPPVTRCPSSTPPPSTAAITPANHSTSRGATSSPASPLASTNTAAVCLVQNASATNKPASIALRGRPFAPRSSTSPHSSSAKNRLSARPTSYQRYVNTYPEHHSPTAAA